MGGTAITSVLVIAEGRGEDLGGAIGVVVIVALVLLVAAALIGGAWLLARRSRRTARRAGPDDRPHAPRHVGRLR